MILILYPCDSSQHITKRVFDSKSGLSTKLCASKMPFLHAFLYQGKLCKLSLIAKSSVIDESLEWFIIDWFPNFSKSTSFITLIEAGLYFRDSIQHGSRMVMITIGLNVIQMYDSFTGRSIWYQSITGLKERELSYIF